MGYSYDIRSILKPVSRMQSDQFLTCISGLIALSTSFHMQRSAYVARFTKFAVPENGYDVIKLSTSFMTLVGVANVFIAAARFNGYCRFNFNLYIFSLVTTLMCNFALGIVLTDYKGQMVDKLSEAMRPKLQESVVSQLSLGVGFKQSELWDFLQTQMKCCGVESYQDYLVKKNSKDQPLPASCCVMKTKNSKGFPEPENMSQCMLDATHKTVESIFLYVQGCRSPLSRWLIRHVSKLTAMIFATICVQALTLLYLSYQGYYSPAPRR